VAVRHSAPVVPPFPAVAQAAVAPGIREDSVAVVAVVAAAAQVAQAQLVDSSSRSTHEH